MPDYHPTHTLVVGDPVTGTDRHDELLVDIFEAAAPLADRLVAVVEAERLGAEYPSVADALDEAFTATPTDEGVSYAAAPSPTSLSAIESLLGTSGGPRVFGIRRIELTDGDAVRVKYVPEHGDFGVDAEPSDGLLVAVREAVADRPAAVLPREPIAEWEHLGTEYGVAPPSLCVGDVCHDLARLRSIDPDPEALTIELGWHERDRGPVGRALGRVSALVGLDRPTTLRFESTEAFETARAALSRVVEATGSG